ncbi:hypothetical protein ACHAW5_009393 [Stephanodiscus triporus]|uniref:Mediator of RNA polymerase II transcription subunit 17 n=1 Tax=Stephanodiscus triporus TaxID=2934178 RepID=A0ABD3PKN0_9STRA
MRPPRPPPLPLSQTETGELATAPLSTVVNAATDALYQDLYSLVHGEIAIVSVASSSSPSSEAGGGGGGGGGTAGGGESKQRGGRASSSSSSSSAAASVEGKLVAAALGVVVDPSAVANDPGAAQSSTAATAAAKSATAPSSAVLLETRRQRMANLSFARRRHELARRVLRHSRSIAHVHALVASSLPVPAARRGADHHPAAPAGARSSSSSGGGVSIGTTTTSLGDAVRASSDALRLARAGTSSLDEAQDALYFHHDGLWKARAHCHDVLGALCVLSTTTPAPADRDGDGVGGGGGRWPDFPADVALAVERYATSAERSYPAPELRARLASAVRGKLVLGEVGEYGVARTTTTTTMSSSSSSSSSSSHEIRRGDDDGRRRTSGYARPLPWRVALEGGGGSVRLTHGAPRYDDRNDDDDDDDEDDRGSARRVARRYPIEARLSVLSEDASASWRLLSVRVRCSPKTGESDHQLVMNRKQMFDLHRICERAMIVEEAVCRRANEEARRRSRDGDGASSVLCDDGEPRAIVPRPLYRLFEVTHAFALSLQMEILSSQAEALRRGAWGGSPMGSKQQLQQQIHAVRDASGECIAVSPAHFYEKNGAGNDGMPAPIAVMAVHFWSCDDSYGSPRVSDLSAGGGEGSELKERDDASSSMVSRMSAINHYLPKNDRRGDNRLSLVIRALPTVGLVVSLSGGSDVAAEAGMKDGAPNHHMLRNIDKLLSSVQNPFELSMSDALLAATVLSADRRCQALVAALNGQTTNKLPSWIYLDVECGTISVAAVISYPTSSASETARPPTVLFRLACDSRTGRFVPVFPRQASLLRLLACNDPSASDIQLLRSSAFGAFSTIARGGNIAKRADITSRDSTGRIVRDSFDALARSMDTLGRKCGVGGEWNDLDAQSASLREKSVDQTCYDVRASLMTSCGMATAFGVVAIALKIACGVDPVADMAGGPINDESNSDLLHVPPLSVPLRQRIVEKLAKEGDGETKRLSQLQRELFAVSAKINNDAIELACFDVLTMSESASSIPKRLEYAEIDPRKADVCKPSDAYTMPPSKWPRITKAAGETSKCHHTLEEVEHASMWLDSLLRQ